MKGQLTKKTEGDSTIAEELEPFGEEFEVTRRSLGRDSGSYSQKVARLWAYGSGAAIGHGYNLIHG